MSQHELVESEPVVSEYATVSETEAMDHSRQPAVRQALSQILRLHDRTEWGDEVLIADDVDWSRLWNLAHQHAISGELEKSFRTLQERYEREYPSLVRIRLEPQSEFDFVPGEYMTIHYHEIPRVYSIACSPNQTGLEICVRRVPGGRLSTQLCDKLTQGDRLRIRGPFSGSFVGDEFILREPSQRDVVFLATGTGVAPFKSMIDYTFEEGFDEYDGGKRNVWLFLGASWKDDLPYDSSFRELSDQHENFHYVPTLSRESLLSDWEGETAYTQQTFVKYLDTETIESESIPEEMAPLLHDEPKYSIDARIDPDTVELYACGINAMVYGIVSVAESVGVPEHVIRGEGYG